jgi:hypothetical protein
LIKPVSVGEDTGTADSYIIPPLVADARSARAALLSRLRALDSAAMGRSELVHSFRVLMHVEQREAALAREVAASCSDAMPWCTEWRDFVAIRLDGDAGRPTDKRWPLGDTLSVASSSLDSLTLAHVHTLSPAARAAFLARLWWLADPLWILAGNERRAEEFARRLDTRARLTQRYDDRYDWRLSMRGAAIAATIMRYGMPDYAWWEGEKWEQPRPINFRGRYDMSEPRPGNGLQTTFEYFRDRVGLMPSLTSVLEPFTTPAWKIHSDPAVAEDTWWPQEHMRLPYPLRQLTGQVGMLRRHEQIVAVVGAQLPPAGGAPEPVEVHLVYSRGPDSVAAVAKRTAFPGSAVAMHGPVGRDSVMIGLEHLAHAPSKLPAGRLRVGAVPPTTLSALAAGVFAVSEPLILLDDIGGRIPLTTVLDALDAVAPSTEVKAGAPLTIYWESYGIAPDQAVTHAVWLERLTDQGALRRLGIRLNIAADLNTPVAVQWDEERVGPRAVPITDGPVPIVGRTITLNTEGLSAGVYRLSVAIARAGAEPVLASREIRVVAR